MPSPDFPTNRNPDRTPDKLPEGDPYTPPPEEMSKPVNGEAPEIGDMLFGAFPAGENGLEVDDELGAMNVNGLPEEWPPENNLVGAKDMTPSGDGNDPSKQEGKPNDDQNEDNTDYSGQIPDQTPEAAGGNGGDEPPDKSPGETDGEDENDGAKELEKCFKNIQSIQEHIAATGDTLSNQDAREINNAIFTLAETVETVADLKTYFDQMIDPTPAETAKAHLALCDAGDEDAQSNLRDLLWSESRGSLTTLYSSRQRGPQHYFDAVMEQREAQGKPVDEFIDIAASAANSPEAQELEKQRMFLQHASRVMPNGGTYAESIEEKVNDMANMLDGEMLSWDAPYALLATTDPEVGRALFERYKDEYMKPGVQNLLTLGDLDHARDLFKTAQHLPKCASFTPEMAEDIMNMMETSAQIIDTSAIDPATGYYEDLEDDLVRHRAEAKVVLSVYTDRPKEVAVMCTDEAIRTINNTHIGGLVEPLELVQKCAEEYMRVGNAEATQQLLETTLQDADLKDMSEQEANDFMEKYMTVAHSCWGAATTAEELTTLGPSERLKYYYDHALREYEFRRTLLLSENKTGWFGQFANYLIEGSLNAPGLGTPEQAAGELAERLAEIDPPAGQQLAGEILLKILQRPVETDIDSLRSFYRVLAGSDDPEHAAITRASIGLAGGSHASILNERTRFAVATKSRTKPDRKDK